MEGTLQSDSRDKLNMHIIIGIRKGNNRKENNLENCKILLLDCPSEIRLIKESLSFFSLPLNLLLRDSIPEALLSIEKDQPDLVMIGSGILIKAGFDMYALKEAIPLVILSEGDGFNILIKKYDRDILFLIRPFDMEGIPGMFEAAYQFLKLCKEKENVLPQNKR